LQFSIIEFFGQRTKIAIIRKLVYPHFTLPLIGLLTDPSEFWERCEVRKPAIANGSHSRSGGTLLTKEFSNSYTL